MGTRSWLAGIALGLGGLLAAPAMHAATVVASYDGARPSQRGDHHTDTYQEHLVRTQVQSGHYDIIADAHGADGDLAFNIDETRPAVVDPENPVVLSQVTITLSGLPFDAVSLEVVNPAESPGEYTIHAIGGGGGSIGAPTSLGQLIFPAGFQGIDALVVTQNQEGAFAFDDLTVTVLPEPSTLASLVCAATLLAGLRRRTA